MIAQAAILVGGVGSRLRSLGFDRPKPLIEIAGRPFVEHVIRHLSAFGVRRVLLLSGYLGDQVSQRYDGATMFGCDLQVLTEPEPLGTLGALGFARDTLDEQFILANGDSIFVADLAEFVSRPLRASSNGRLLLRTVEDSARFGTVELDPEGTITAFKEKSPENRGHALINAGVYLLNRDAALAGIRPGSCSIEHDLFPLWAKSGTLEGRIKDGYFIDIGVPDSYHEAYARLESAVQRPAAFLDRDGVINIDDGYTHKIADLKFTSTAVKGIRALNQSNHLVVVVTNQAGVARGLYSEGDVVAFNNELQRQLLVEGAHIDAFYYCPFSPAGVLDYYRREHEDRKPRPGMLVRAMRDLPIDPQASFLIGDRSTDVEAAAAAGIPGYLVPANVCDLEAEVQKILSAQGLRQ